MATGSRFWALGEMVRAPGRPARDRRRGDEPREDRGDRPAARAGSRRADAGSSRRCSRCSASAAAPGRTELFAAWRTFFERLAASAPVIMVFEDLHHADSGLLDFIDHLMEWSRGVPIAVITLSRPELLERRPGLGRRQAHVHLASISSRCRPDAMRELLAGLVPGLPGPAVAAIVEPRRRDPAVRGRDGADAARAGQGSCPRAASTDRPATSTTWPSRRP